MFEINNKITKKTDKISKEKRKRNTILFFSFGKGHLSPFFKIFQILIKHMKSDFMKNKKKKITETKVWYRNVIGILEKSKKKNWKNMFEWKNLILHLIN